MFRIINNFTPIIIKNMFSIKQCIYSQINIFKFVIPSFRLNIKKICKTYNGPFLWNLLENKFKLFNNIHTFTRILKYNYISILNITYFFLILYYILYIFFIYFQLYIFFKYFKLLYTQLYLLYIICFNLF